MFTRELYPVILDQCFKGKAIILLGARQVGKTTLLRQVIQTAQTEVQYLNCDEPQVVEALTNRNLRELVLLVGKAKYIVIDEAQKVNNIGLTLKLIVDNIPDVQVIATGSSAFELRNRLNEPLTGRKFEYQMYPISTNEIYQSSGYVDVKRLLETRLIYGSYPEVLSNLDNAQSLLLSLSDSYLYKDILTMDSMRKPDVLNKLLQALAFQIGSEVSYNELAQTIGTDSKTVEKYIDLLEKCFIIFRLNGLSRNLRNELKKAKKIYFCDNGVRNAVIQQFAPVALRNDMGQLWENFFISERIKRNHYLGHHCNIYFWRTTSQQEIDYIEEEDGLLHAIEFKWNEQKGGKTRCPAAFASAYPDATFQVITPQNVFEFLSF